MVSGIYQITYIHLIHHRTDFNDKSFLFAATDIFRYVENKGMEMAMGIKNK